MDDPPQPLPAPFVVGVARSGTTLLRLMLDAHPELAIPPETRFVPRLISACRDGQATPDAAVKLLTAQRNWSDFGIDPADLLGRMSAAPRLTPAVATRAFFEAYAARFGKRRWGDKTPTYAARMPMIAAALPEARFVHLVRDGRDVVLSWRRFRELRGDDPRTVEHWASAWVSRIEEARAKASRVSHYTELRYEDLVTDAESMLRRLGEFIDLPFDDRMLAHHESAAERLAELAVGLPRGDRQQARSAEDRMAPHELASEPPRRDRAGAWRAQMSGAERREFERVGGKLLAELGYEI